MMKKIKQIFLTLLLSFMTSNVIAADVVPGLLGFNLGSKIEGEDCPKSGAGVVYPPVCIKYVNSSSWKVGAMVDNYQVLMDFDRLPAWAGAFTLIVQDGLIVEMSLNTRGLAVETDAYDAIVKRLGRPKTTGVKNWRHRQVGMIQSRNATWNEKTWFAVFEGVFSQLDTGYLTISKRVEIPKQVSPAL
jgi:hypothetical protein